MKNGRILNSICDNIPLKENAKITDRKKPKKDTNCLINPLLNPTKAPKPIIIKIIISTAFMFIHPFYLIILYYTIKIKHFMLK